MPKRRWPCSGGLVFHVWNRAVRRATLFDTSDDFLAFIRTIVEAQSKVDMRLLEWCLTGNHFHFLLWPRADGDLSPFLYVISQLRRGGESSNCWHPVTRTTRPAWRVS